MVPSDSKRRFCLKVNNAERNVRIWTAMGVGIVFIGVVCSLILSGHTINDSQSCYTLPCWIIGIPIILFGILYILIAQLFLKRVYKGLSEGVINYSVTSAPVNKYYLLEEAARTNCGMDSNFIVEVFDDWIDISLNWRNCISIGNPTFKNVSMYKKIILIKDNYTFEELDYECNGSVDLALNNFNVSKEIKCGKIRRKQFDYNFGKDLNTGNFGINSYKLDTLEVTNKIHKWLASHGYKPA